MYTTEEMKNNIFEGDVLEQLKQFPDESIDMIITSPPYYGLRRYKTEPSVWGGNPDCIHQWKYDIKKGISGGTKSKKVHIHGQENFQIVSDTKFGFCSLCGAWLGELGSEPDFRLYIEHLLIICDELKRVLKSTGSLWWNIDDSRSGSNQGAGADRTGVKQGTVKGTRFTEDKNFRSLLSNTGIAKKSLMGIPDRFKIGMIDRGWVCRNEIIWCLSGGTYVYAQTQSGFAPTMIKDLIRLAPETVKLWNGKKWKQVLGWNKNKKVESKLELTLRSGERINCTSLHKFPTQRGLLKAHELIVGDELQRVELPDVENPRDCAIDLDAAWFAGLYIAEGSRSEYCISLAGHSKEEERWNRIQKIAKKFGGSTSRTINGNNMSIRIWGKVLNSIIDELVSGHDSHDKGFSTSVWKYSNFFINEMLNGYLSGDGSLDVKNNRWRLGFTRNYNLEKDLRTVCARLGYHLILNLSTVKYKEKEVPTFLGEIRFKRSGHFNEKNTGEIVKIKTSTSKNFYDISVKDKPHLFALSSGILTHNCKPNQMPDPAKDRFTDDFEKLFFFTKNGHYYFEQQFDPYTKPMNRWAGDKLTASGESTWDKGTGQSSYRDRNMRPNPKGKNKRTVWSINTKAYKSSHVAVYPETLIDIPIKAGCPKNGIILDPFMGSGTSAIGALNNGCYYVGIERNPKYIEIAEKRIDELLEGE